MDGVTITALQEARPDERGKAFELSVAERRGTMYITRKQGTISGRHYHLGKTAGKNPEVIIILSGIAEFYCKDLKTREEMTVVIDVPTRIEVSPFIWHELKALTDVSLLELSSLEEHTQDTVREMPP